MRLTRAFPFFLAFLVLLSASQAAFASTLTYSFSFSGGNDSGSGVFTLMSTSTAGEYTFTGISGSSVINGLPSSTISTLLAPTTFPANNPSAPNQANDNLAFPSTTFLDYQGVSFSLFNAQEINLFYDSDGRYAIYTTGLASSFDLTSFTVTPQVAVTPEPPSALLLGTGMLAVGLVVAGRRKFVAAA